MTRIRTCAVTVVYFVEILHAETGGLDKKGDGTNEGEISCCRNA